MNTHVSLPSREEILARKMRLGVISNPAMAAARMREREQAERARAEREAEERAREEERLERERREAETQENLDAISEGKELRISLPKYLLREIVEAVSEIFGVPVRDILSSRRPDRIVRPRQIAMWAAHFLTNRTTSEIGKYIGDRDHTTAIAARKRVEALISAGKMSVTVDEIEAKILARRTGP